MSFFQLLGGISSLSQHSTGRGMDAKYFDNNVLQAIHDRDPDNFNVNLRSAVSFHNMAISLYQQQLIIQQQQSQPALLMEFEVHPETKSRLLTLLGGDTEAMNRLVAKAQQKAPKHSLQQCYQQVIQELLTDRNAI